MLSPRNLWLPTIPECVRLTTDLVIKSLVDQRKSKFKLVGHFKNKRRCIFFLGPLVAALCILSVELATNFKFILYKNNDD